VDELRRELKVHHLGWQVLSAGVVQSDATILTASDEEFAIGRVCQFLERLVELCKLTHDTSLLDVENSHGSISETAREDGQAGMSCHAQRLFNVAGELDLLLKGLHVPKADRLVFRYCHDASLGKVEVETEDRIGVSSHQSTVLLV